MPYRHVFAVLVIGLLAVLTLGAEKPADLIAQADRLFDEKHYKEAGDAYAASLDAEPRHDKWVHASERLIIARLRMQQFDAALDAAHAYIDRAGDDPQSARAHRLTGNLYMMIPHWGTRAGGEFHRAQHKQGIRVRSWQYDKQKAVTHMETARDLYARFDDSREWREERIDCLFDLANIYSRFGIFDNQPQFWHSHWAERNDELAETAGEDDFDEYYSHRQWHRKRPIGLRVDDEGNPIFPTKPDEFARDLPDERKILFVLDEVRKLDPTETKKFAALSLYRQAMLARSRFGMDRLNQYAGMYNVNGKQPLQEQMESFKPWELADDESLILAGGQVVVATLPPQWDVLGLLDEVVENHAQSGQQSEAQYAVGVYLQSRQQYTRALAAYQTLKDMAAGEGEWNSKADTQISRIRQPQVSLSDTGVQAPGQAAALQLSYRNTSEVHFVARRIDLEGLLRAIHDTDDDHERGRHFTSLLHNWHHLFVQDYNKDYWAHPFAAPFLGEEVARWSADVVDDGTHRYAQAEVDTPLDARGTYLIYAHLKPPPADLAEKQHDAAFGLGDSRAVLAISDLAFVEKKTKSGNLYYVCDALSGAPAPEAAIQVMHTWHTYDRAKRKSIFHKRIYNLTADAQGMATLKPQNNHNGQLHLIVKSGDRLAWSGMTYWSRYNPSNLRRGDVAYIITDRPVYRPGQTVHYKAWVRNFVDGEPQTKTGQSVNVQVYDRKGNKIHELTQQTDQFGGIDGELTLEEEPPLGQYNIQLRLGNRHIGGKPFRVEEYKKPEFEVTVQPGSDHVKLGEKVEAKITTKYYFGSPVSEGEVSYKVFREQYTHSYHFPGRWDWLYGSGYGLPWYESPWFEWWPVAARCWSPPTWWWWQGAPNPVRELVMEGEDTLSADGTLSLTIDTAPALQHHGDHDHRYIIEAEVTDPSRRVIEGSGSVTVTRQAYYAFVRAERGWYRPGEDMTINIRALTPDNKPVQTEGVVTITDVAPGSDNAQIRQVELERFTASTDADGLLTFKRRYEKSGQLRIKFEAPDKWGGIVEGYGLVWIVGRDFTGELHKFNDLELITDKRTYQPGETAHVMLNVKQPGSYVLFSDDVDNNHLLSHRLIHVAGRSTVIDVPVTKTHKPNFFVEATVVRDLRVHEQMRRILVPPEEGVMDIAVTTDKSEYLPGEEARVKVKALSPDGEPARAQVVLAAFDKSVLYIQPRYAADIASVFHGQTRHHHMVSSTNVFERFSAQGYVRRPFQDLHPLPDAWSGLWNPTWTDWRTIDDDELKNFRGNGNGGASYFGGEVMERKAVARQSMAMDGVAAAAPPAPMMAKAEMQDSANATGGAGGGGGEPQMAETEVRTEFADTALWLPTLTTDDAGVAEATFTMPQNLTTWQVDSWAMTKATRVGQASTSVVTRKNLLVRLQAPRFFVERDEVVVSANVHNDFDEAITARVSIDIYDELMTLLNEKSRDVQVASHGQTRVDWRVKVKREGVAKITVKAQTPRESDAMAQTFPVLVHGMTKQIATTGSMRPDETDKTLTVELNIPDERKPELTRLEVQFSPSLIGAMLDALPYCLDYPYGCTEQTMSRFLPAVLTRKTIDNLGINLEDIRNARGRLDEIRRIEQGENVRFPTYADSPVFDDQKLQKIINKSLARIAEMQNGDGGWGWWSNDRSSPYLTSYVLYALTEANGTDVTIDGNMIQRGMNFLQQDEASEMREEGWSVHTQHAFAAWVLSRNDVRVEIEPGEKDERPAALIDRLYAGRDKLNLYGKALLTLTLHNFADDRAATVLRNIMQHKQENDETQLAWFDTPSGGWWYWWNNDIETNAWILRAIVALEPQSDVAPRLVKWLLNNRRNGYYWRSTRDTTLVIAAMSDFVNASGEADPDFTLTLDYDNGAVTKTVKIDRTNFFTYDNRFVLEGAALTSGKHTLKVTKTGKGALYFNTYLKYFTMEEPITKAGHELKVDRTYFKLQRIDYEVDVDTADGGTIKEKRLRYERIPLKQGDQLQSGDLVQVELRVASDNNYTYLAFEDPKPAGCEPTELRSGSERQEGFSTFMELRDEKVVFFMNSIEQGEHLLRHRLRAEIPGEFHALPTTVYGMYVPELRANSDEQVITITD